jgi:hypothetical protein
MASSIPPAASPQPPGDPQGAVVEHRIAPDEQGEAAALGQVCLDFGAPEGGDRRVPVVDGADIGGGAIAHGHVEFDDPGAFQSGAERAAQVDQIGLVAALARQEDEIGPGHRAPGLRGQVVRVAGADADQRQVDHVAAPIRWKNVPVTMPRREPVSGRSAPLASSTRASGSSRCSTIVE